MRTCASACARESRVGLYFIYRKNIVSFFWEGTNIKKRCRVCVSFRVFLFDNIFLKNIWQNNHFVFDPFNFPYVFWWFSRQKNVWIVFFKFLIYGRVTCKTFLHCSQKKPRTTLILGPICSSIYLWRPLRLRVSSFSSRKQQIIVYISMLRHQSVNIKPVYILWTKKQTHTLHTHTHTRDCYCCETKSCISTLCIRPPDIEIATKIIYNQNSSYRTAYPPPKKSTNTLCICTKRIQSLFI